MRRLAFIMGSNGPVGNNQLRYALNDVERIKDVLSQPHCGFEVTVAVEEEKPSDVLDKLADVAASCKNEDTFICYFSGHGLPDKNSLFLFWDKTESNKLISTALLYDNIEHILNFCNAGSKLLILDCCNAGYAKNRHGIKSPGEVHKEDTKIENYIKNRNYSVLMASDRLENAREFTELQGSFLTTNVCLALSDDFIEADKDKDGKISVHNLIDWLEIKVLEHNKKSDIKDHVPQVHHLITGTGSFLLAEKISNLIGYKHNIDECPYQALEPFYKSQNKFFKGRKLLVDKLKDKLDNLNFVFLIGASGSGKSSVVQAGLTAKLEAEGWQVLEPITPWTDPVGCLKGTIAQQLFTQIKTRNGIFSLIDKDGLFSISQHQDIPIDKKVLIIIDQFEEIFTVSTPNEQNKFIDLLTKNNNISSRLKVVATLRADFLEDCLKNKSLTQLIENQAVWIPPLDTQDLKQIIVEPAREQGYSFEEGVPEQIINEIGQEKNFLPQLQYALTALWELRDQKTLKLTASQYLVYKNQGGFLQVLNHRAEEIYQSFSEKKEKEWVKRIFLKLVRTGTDSDTKDARQRLPKQKLLEIAENNLQQQEEIQNIINKLVKERLLVAGKDIEGTAWIDLAHEALMDRWEQFSLWRKEGRELRRLRDRVEDTYKEWEQYKQDPKFLMMGGLLAQVEEKWSDLEQELSRGTKEFYELSKSYQGEHDELLQKKLEEHKKEIQLELQKYQIEAQKDQSKLEAKDVQIEFYRQQIQDLKKDIEYFKSLPEREMKLLLAEKDARILSLENLVRRAIEHPKFYVENYNKEGTAMTGARTINTGGGNYNERIEGSYVQGNYYGAQKQSLAEAAAEIQQLLEQLDKTYSSNTTAEKMKVATEALIRIENNPTLKQRIIEALKSGSAYALEEIISHPAASFVIAALGDWQKYDGDSTD